MAQKKGGQTVRFLTPPFRLSFPNLFEAKAMNAQSKPKFGCSAVWTPSGFSDADKKLWSAITAAMNEESKRAFGKLVKELPSNYKKGLRRGDEKEGMEGYGPGTVFANLTTKMRPGVVDKDGTTAIGPEEGNADLIYPGCYCRATVTVYSYNNKGKGIALGLMNVQKIKDGERLDSRTDASEDFQEQVDSAWLDEDEEAVEADADEDDEIPF